MTTKKDPEFVAGAINNAANYLSSGVDTFNLDELKPYLKLYSEDIGFRSVHFVRSLISERYLHKALQFGMPLAKH